MSAALKAAWIVSCLAFVALGAIFLLAPPDGAESRSPLPARIASGLFLVLVLARAPTLFLFDRVWAEAGNLYFAYAYEHGPWSALIRQVSNYFDLTANLASAAAVELGLRFWPLVDTVFGFLPLMLLPFVLIGMGFTPRERIGLMLVLAVAVYSIYSAEVFGTMLHVKGWGAVYAFLLLLSLALKRELTSFHKCLLVLLPLTGPAATMLFLIFGGMTVMLRPMRSYGFLLWALPGLAVQIISALQPGQQTGFAVRPASLLSLVQGADLLLVKGFGSLFMVRMLADNRIPGGVELIATNIALAIILLMALYFYIRRPERRDFILLLPVQVFHFLGTVLLSLGGQAAGLRYLFPAICMAAAFLMLTKAATQGAFRYAVVALCALIVLIDHRANRFIDQLILIPHAPSWQSQLLAQEHEPTKLLTTYPTNWQFILPNCGEYFCDRSN